MDRKQKIDIAKLVALTIIWGLALYIDWKVTGICLLTQIGHNLEKHFE